MCWEGKIYLLGPCMQRPQGTRAYGMMAEGLRAQLASSGTETTSERNRQRVQEKSLYFLAK